MWAPKGTTEIEIKAQAERDHGGQDVERPVYIGGHQVFFKEELEAVGHGLPQAERTNAGGSPAILDAADNFALQQHGVGYGAEEDRQHHGNLQTTQQKKDQEAHGVFRFGLSAQVKSVPQA